MSMFGSPEPEDVRVSGIDLQCVICHNAKFWHRQAQLHTAFLSFLDIEWLGRNADCLVCSKCGYVHWFLPTTNGDGS